MQKVPTQTAAVHCRTDRQDNTDSNTLFIELYCRTYSTAHLQVYSEYVINTQHFALVRVVNTEYCSLRGFPAWWSIIFPAHTWCKKIPETTQRQGDVRNRTYIFSLNNCASASVEEPLVGSRYGGLLLVEFVLSLLWSCSHSVRNCFVRTACRRIRTARPAPITH